MGAISKTAKASMVKEVRKSETETLEQTIRKIRLGLSSSPVEYIPAHRVRTLLTAYDALVAAQNAERVASKPSVLGAPYDLSNREPLPDASEGGLAAYAHHTYTPTGEEL